MVNVKLGIIGESVVAMAKDESGDAPSAFTIDELRDVVMGLSGEEAVGVGKGNSFKLLVIDRVLETFQSEYITCNAEPSSE